ncbi:MAG TPA: formylmethanofuran dehydrogenase subunit B [Gammaproteobacteria bacterium]|nr:formylmethanofuran dehydrogenase subunit B [Gammaproteobacteria bacterium]
MIDSSHQPVPLNAVCPFCSLLCDDLRIAVDGQALTLIGPSCGKARAGFADGSIEDVPLVAGVQATHHQAIERAAALLAGSRHPVFGGLATDIDGMRTVMMLADRCGGSVDHMDGDTLARKNGLLATRGAISTTLAEVANRADLILLLGEDALGDGSRFIERCVTPGDSLHPERLAARELVVLAPRSAARALQGISVPTRHLPMAMSDAAEVASALRALLAGRTLAARAVAGIRTTDLAEVAARLAAARYAVIVWGKDLSSAPHSEVAMELLNELLKDLNRNTRAASLVLGGSDGAASANAVCAWQAGYGLRTSFASGGPEHDPTRFSARQLIEDGTADLLIWISAYATRQTPPADLDCPTIVLGRSGMRFDVVPDIYIPVGTPGIDHPGRLIRTDSSVSLPLPALRESGLPSVRQVLGQLAALVLP